MRTAVVLLLLVITHASCQAQRQDEPMNILFYRTDVEHPISLSVAPTAIRPAEHRVRAAAVPEEGAYQRPLANAQRNARLPVSAEHGVREVRWKAALDAAFAPHFVLHRGNRVVVQQEGAWQLFDTQGVPLAEGARSAGDMVIDTVQKVFYLNTHNGLLEARELSTGAVSYSLFPMFGAGYIRSVLASQEQRLWIVGTELPVMSHRDTRPPEYTLLEVQDLGHPLEQDEDGILTSNQRLETLMTRPVPMLAAMHNQTLVLAAPGHVFLIDDALQVQADLQGAFTPLAMSLDESGFIYLIVWTEEEEGGQRHALWVLTPQGERLVDVALPERAEYGPPIIGYNRLVYILLDDRVLAVSPEGEVRWNEHAGGPVAGAVATADGQLLVAAGGYIVAFDPAGERSVFFYEEGTQWMTPPVLTERQRLFIASEQYLYCLQHKP